MQHPRLTLTLAAAFALTGCVSVNQAPLTADSSTKLQSRSVVSSKYATPDFTAMTAGKAAFAILGAVAMIAEGNAIVRDNAIDDPALSIAADLQTRLGTAKGMTAITGSAITSKNDLPSVIASNPGADYVLDVQTTNWSFLYFPTNWTHYRVMYSARVRLIDAATKTVVAEAGCRSVPSDDKNAPTYDELLADKAALLKSHLAKAAAECVDQVARDTLKV
ncbi:hypothetical protein [Mitsuaria sp. 7]|uniref:hypothetical protein n=1 Tax=Mitsuaria sp. 7 TaxID=1658665 RepID=UPI00083135D5|nr:hypothetical protein [Mitsuaria sp. 7]